MGSGSARRVHTRLGRLPVAVTPVTPYPTGRGSRPEKSTRKKNRLSPKYLDIKITRAQ